MKRFLRVCLTVLLSILTSFLLVSPIMLSIALIWLWNFNFIYSLIFTIPISIWGLVMVIKSTWLSML